jgi:phosphoglycolate phosphatase
MKYQYVIWDFNGTLLDDVKLCFDLLNKMLSKRGFETVTIEKYKEIFRFPVKEYYRLAGFDFEKEPFEVTAVEFIDDYQPMSLKLSLYPNTFKVLETIKNSKTRQLILSASKLENLLEQTKHFGLDPYMDFILGIDTIHATSKVMVAKDWIRENGVDPKKVLFIGDTDHDYEVATSIGVDCLLIANGHQSKERLLKVTSNVVDDIIDTLEVIF